MLAQPLIESGKSGRLDDLEASLSAVEQRVDALGNRAASMLKARIAVADEATQSDGTRDPHRAEESQPGRAPSRRSTHRLLQHVAGLPSAPAIGGMKRRRSKEPPPEAGDLDIVQFSAPIYYVEEDEGVLQIDLMRLGRLDGSCRVKYQTIDASAKAGVRYEASSGEVVFEDGEFSKTIDARVIPTDAWSTTMEFKITLFDPVGCNVGLYLRTCRVKVIDNDPFPSGKFKDNILEGEEGIERISGIALFIEYLKLNFWAAPGVGWRTLLLLTMNQLQNVYVFFTLYVNVYLVDVLFNTTEKETSQRLLLPDRSQTAVVIGIMYVLPMFFIHAWDYLAIELDIGGLSEHFLRANLFRKYLNYSEESRSKVQPQDMHVTIVTDTSEVAEGYAAFLKVLRMFSKLLILSFFILQENPGALLSVVTMPTFLFIFGVLRKEVLQEAAEVSMKKTAQMVGVVQEACMKYRLIADFMQRPYFCDVFEAAVEKLNVANITTLQIKVNNSYFPKWLGPLYVGFYIATQAKAVLSDEVSLGTFLATIRIFTELSTEFAEAYVEMIKIFAAIGPLRKLTSYFNMKTDLLDAKGLNRKRREHTLQARRKLFSNGAAGNTDVMFKTDLLQLDIENLCFRYSGASEALPWLLENVTLTTPQGSLIGVVGPHGSGKKTFLSLLGQTMLPTQGSIFVPSHLRVLHVSQEPMLLRLSVWENLTFGNYNADPKHVKDVVEALSMPKALAFLQQDIEEMEKLEGQEEQAVSESETDENENVVAWQDVLSYAERAKMHLARAFIANPEVLVLQRPLIHYNEKEAKEMLGLIVRHTKEKGLCLPQEQSHRRRPRTCFFTPDSREEAAQADKIWRLGHGQKTVQEVTKEDLSPEDF